MSAANRTVLMACVALLLAACAEPAAPPVVRPALVTQASAGAAAHQVFAGEVHAREEPELAFRIGGKIARRLVDAGAHVRAGQPMAELDPADARLQSEAARAQLSSAESDLALARAEMGRYKDLADRQLVSRSLYDSRVAALQAAQARVRQARAGVSSSGNQVGYAVLRAPRDGVVARRLAEAGQVVAAGQPVFVLAVDGPREVAISVPEQRLAEFKVGRAVMVELWADPGKRFPGTLREISPAADPLTRTFAARVAFDPGVERADLGQSARVLATAVGDSATLRVPLPALGRHDGKPVVWVVEPGSQRVRPTPVRVGPYSEEGVPVIAGLADGAWVVAAGVHLLQDGQVVRPIDRDNRPVRIAAARNTRNSPAGATR